MSQELSWQGVAPNLGFEVNYLNNLFLCVRNYTAEVVEHCVLFVGFYLLLCIILYFGIVKWQFPKFNREIKSPTRILIVIAHPDDECMFFGPTVLNLVKSCNSTVYLLCLSNGANYGMGKIRQNELYRACSTLGIKSENITIKSHSLMPDSISKNWPIEIVEKLILKEVKSLDIDTLITFDKYGISGHPNHCSIFYGVLNLCLEDSLPKSCAIYLLETVTILRKYSLIFDIPLSFLLSRTRYFVGFSDRKIIHQAMKQHKSQLVWFRWLYLYFSRYMLINTLYKLEPMDIQFEFDLE